ncbi:MAG: fimbrillin family protein [Muribaculaceae bacterium]|nr:fimbrillin family protein [Muribaculaceae bacterium]
MSPKRIFYSIGLALTLASCADELVTDRYDSDGSISFTVDPQGQAFSTRGGNAAPSLSYHGTIPLEGETPLWLHLESFENPVVTNAAKTRGMPKTIADVETFHVTAVLDENDNDKFIDNAEVNKSGNIWKTEDTYYWPKSSSLTFYCTPEELPVTVTPANGNFTFDYTVPVSDNEKDAESQPDFVLATHRYTRAQTNDGCAEIKFRHPLAGICFRQDENLSQSSDGNQTSVVKITKIELSGLKGEGSCVFNGFNNGTVDFAKWTITDNADKTYVQTAGAESVEISFNADSDKPRTINAVAEPFMVIPQTDLSNFKCKVTVEANGVTDVKEVSLAKIGGGKLEPGRMYVITLSNLDGKYPPVENLQGMAGFGTVSLTWDNPEQSFPHIHQCGVTVVIIQKDAGGNETSRLEKVIHWGDTHTEPYPSKSDDTLDLFAYVKEGYKLIYDNDKKEWVRAKDDKGDDLIIKIDTKNNEEFECHVIADYYNENDKADGSYPDPYTVHQSIARTITIKPEKTNDKFLFYVPTGGILDDDDKAAWEWFKKTYPEGMQVRKEDLNSEAKIQDLLDNGYNVMWFPCGVKLREGGDHAGFNRDPIGDNDSEINNYISQAESILTGSQLKEINVYAENKLDRYYDYENNLAPTLQRLGSVAGMFDNPSDGTIRKTDPNTYFTDDDILAIREFYNAGGNLLLTTFSIELIYEFEIITAVNRKYGPGEGYPYRPNFRFFNEIKPSSIWFLRPNFRNHDNKGHLIYKDLFICNATIFPETELDVFNGEYPIFVASDPARTEQMYPLLSMGADACENNNVIWDFNRVNKEMENMENDNNARFLGTWGQIGDNSVGVAIEFYPGATESAWPWDRPEDYIRDHWYPEGASDAEKDRIRKAVMNHGRCIAIGLGAYEFNNGLKYDPAGEILNMYQSNVQKLTSNSLKYLKDAKSDERAPGEKVTR